MQHELIIYEKECFFNDFYVGIFQSAVCFSHCEIEALPLSSVLIPILVIGNRLAEQLQKREQTQGMWDADKALQCSEWCCWECPASGEQGSDTLGLALSCLPWTL